jgi:cytochrome c biogenesis protein CcmG/thiol:disulfide interchange protein DsbE
MSDPDTSEVLELPGGPNRLAFWISIPVALILGLFIVVLATSEGDTGQPISSLVGKAAPEITGQTLAGDTFSLEDHRGKWVVVNFFQTTCIPCIEEHPELVAFSEAHEAVGDAIVVSLAFSDTEANVRDFFDEYGGEWPVLAADTGRYAIGYGVAAVPETFIVSPQGVVVAKYLGGVDAAGLDAELNRLAVTLS